MTQEKFLADLYNGLSPEVKEKVHGLFLPIAGSSISTLKAIEGVKLPINVLCTGDNTELYCRCLLDSILLSKAKRGDVVSICVPKSTSMVGMLGMSMNLDIYENVLVKAGYTPVEIEKEKYEEEDKEDELTYELIHTKSISDCEGYNTDYSWYKCSDGRHVFVFGDSEVYNPKNSDIDHECETEREAQEWFDSYGEESKEGKPENDTPKEEPKEETKEQPKAVESPVEDTKKENKEEDDSQDTEPRHPSSLDEEIDNCLGGTIGINVDNILGAYNLLYSSGFDLVKPFGVLTSKGVYYVNASNHAELRSGSTSMDYNTVRKMYGLFQGELSFVESNYRSPGTIGLEIVKQYMSDSQTVLYFPFKCLEIMYGRVPSSASAKELKGETVVYYAYSKHHNSWSAYKAQEVEGHIKKLLTQCVKCFLESIDCTKLEGNNDALDGAEKLLSYAQACLTSCIGIVEYKAFNRKPAKIKIRVSDPMCKLNSKVDYMDAIIKTAFMGNFGGEGANRLKSGLSEDLSNQFHVYEYAHEFDSKMSNALPLFAYRAAEILQERGDKVSWENAIIGQSMDGTILKAGSSDGSKISYSKTLVHHICAGSGAGKGVMTLNTLASGIASNKAIFYFDDKPDMASLLAKLAHGSDTSNPHSINGPDMFVINGRQMEKDVEKEFIHANSWIIPEHIPQEARNLFKDTSWGTLGELFYFRAFMLCMGIVLARGADDQGKKDDPMFGGKEGLMIVLDEFTNHQMYFKALLKLAGGDNGKIPLARSSYRSRVRELKQYFKDPKKKDTKLSSMIDSFTAVFSADHFYSLSLFKMLGECVESLSAKQNSGFDRKYEVEYTDIFIIGQQLANVPVSEKLKTLIDAGRYPDGERGKFKQSEGNAILENSIPYRMTLFREQDAFLGYNNNHRDYLSQGDSSSNAYSILNDTVRGFAYLKFETPAEGHSPDEQFKPLSVANSPNTMYFKPYLILNSSDPESKFVTDMFGYAFNDGKGATKEQIIAEYPDKDDPTKLSRYVGFEEYMSLLGLKDLTATLRKGADIANYVVGKYLGYVGMPGSKLPLWLQFVTDLRIDWMFSPQDVWALCTGKGITSYDLGKKKDSNICGEYYQYLEDLAEMQKMGIPISDPAVAMSEQDGSVTEESVRRFEEEAGLGSTEDGSNPVAEAEAETRRMSRAMGDTINPGDTIDMSDEEPEGKQEEENKPDGKSFFDSIKSTNAAGSASPEFVSEAASKVNMDEVTKALELLRKNGMNVPVDLGGYTVDTKGNMTTGNTPATEQSDISEAFEGFSDTSSKIDFESIVNNVTTKVIRDYGGLARIRSFAIVGGAIAINNVIYRCKLNPAMTKDMYVDLRKEVNAGNITKLFNYKMLAGMTNLTELKCDSRSFMYDYVNFSAFGSSDVPIRAYFEALPSLMSMQVGNEKYTRESVYAEDSKDPFFIQTKGSKFFEAVHNGAKKWNQGSWSWGKSKLTDKHSKWYQKILWTPIVIGAVGVSGITRATSAGVSAVKNASDRERSRQKAETKIGGFVDSFKQGFKSAKDNIKDLFSDD